MLKFKHRGFDRKLLNDYLKHLAHLDFSVIIDHMITEPHEVSDLNFLILQEPNEYFGLHDYAIKNEEMYTAILTWDDRIINACENAVFLPFGHTWFKKEQYEVDHPKKFEVAFLRGNLLKTHGHQFRYDILERGEEIKIPKKFYATYGDRYNIEEARKGKEEVFSTSQYGIAIENTSHRGYFTEKILDLFLLKTIPIYWGCSNIGDFFNEKGIIKVDNMDDIVYFLNNTSEDYYNSLTSVIEENYQKALQYVDYEKTIANKIEEILKLNNLY